MNQQHVIFGTGPLGMSVMRELVRRGQPVRMVNRSGKAEVPQNVEVVAGNAYDSSFVRQITQDAAVVYQCAQPAYTEWAAKFPPLQAAIIEGVSANTAKLVVGDNLYLYGDVNGVIHENLPPAATNRKGTVRAQMAAAVMAAHQSGKIRATVARGSDFFGPLVHDSAIGARELYPILAGKKVSALGNPDAPHSFTFIDDFGKAMVILGERDEALGQAWHVPNAPTISTREILKMCYEAAGQTPQKVGRVPKPMLQLVGLFSPVVREVVEMWYEFEKPFVVDSSKFVKAFGDIATPHRDAICTTIEWFKAHPQHK
jgi:nucleoside-diphosphate-sugar epimerase